MCCKRVYLIAIASFLFFTVVKGSCLEYGHSCWGAHGKRNGGSAGGSKLVLEPRNLRSIDGDGNSMALANQALFKSIDEVNYLPKITGNPSYRQTQCDLYGFSCRGGHGRSSGGSAGGSKLVPEPRNLGNIDGNGNPVALANQALFKSIDEVNYLPKINGNPSYRQIQCDLYGHLCWGGHGRSSGGSADGSKLPESNEIVGLSGDDIGEINSFKNLFRKRNTGPLKKESLYDDSLEQ